MNQTVDSGEKKVAGNAVLSQNQNITAGRKNLLSAIWSGRNSAAAPAMPNGDPPSLMLWGAEDEMADKRYNLRHGRA